MRACVRAAGSWGPQAQPQHLAELCRVARGGLLLLLLLLLLLSVAASIGGGGWVSLGKRSGQRPLLKCPCPDLAGSGH